jgi:hypothetical protein
MQLFQMEDGAPAASSSGQPQAAAAQPQSQRQPDFSSGPAAFGAGAPNTLDEPLWVSEHLLKAAVTGLQCDTHTVGHTHTNLCMVEWNHHLCPRTVTPFEHTGASKA